MEAAVSILKPQIPGDYMINVRIAAGYLPMETKMRRNMGRP